MLEVNAPLDLTLCNVLKVVQNNYFQELQFINQ